MLHILKQNPLFFNLTDEALEHLIHCHKPRTVSFVPNETIFSWGDTLDEVGIVMAGRIALMKSDYEGNETIIQTMKPSESFGEAVAVTPHARSSVYAIAKEQSIVVFFRMGMFFQQAKHPCDVGAKIQQNLMRVLAQKLILLHKKIDILSKRTIREKVLEYFMQLSEGKETFLIPLNRQAFANYLNVDRSALAREMKHMQEEGLLTLSGREVTWHPRTRSLTF